MTITQNEKPLDAIFGYASKEEEAAKADAAQTEKDWAFAEGIAARANARWPEIGEWRPSLSFGWQAHAVCVTPDGPRMTGAFPDGSVYHYAPDEYTIAKTEIRGT